MQETWVPSLGFQDPLEQGRIRLQYGCLENPMDSGVWQAIVHEVAQNWTRLKQLSMDAGQMFTHYGKFVCLVCVFVCLCVLVAS